MAATLKAGALLMALVTVALSLILGPYLRANAEMLTNTKSTLKVAVANLDGGLIGNGLVQYLQAAAASGAVLPGYELISAVDVPSVAALSALVDEDEDYWAGIAVAPGASAALMQAVLAAPNATGYNPAHAITFIWSEGRSPTIAPRLSSPTRVLLAKFTAVVAANLAQAVVAMPGGATRLATLAASAPSLLAAPVGYTEVNLHPAAQWPVSMQALTVGIVMVAVMSYAASKQVSKLLPAALPSLSPLVDAAGWKPVDGLWSAPHPPALLHKRAVALLLASAAIGSTYAILVATISGDTFTPGGPAAPMSAGNGWGALFGAAMLLSCCFTWFMAGVAEITGDADSATVFAILVYYNALSGWNLELAPAGYDFFKYAPMYHAARLLRAILFGSMTQDHHVGNAVGVLVFWAAFGLVAYYVLALLVKPRLAVRLAARKHQQQAGDAGAVEKPPAPAAAAATEEVEMPQVIVATTSAAAATAV